LARRLLVAVLGTTLLLAAATPASAGGQGKLLYWAGHTSQSQQIDFGLVRSHHGQRFIGFDVGIQLTCDDSSVQDWIMGSRLYPGQKLVAKQLDYYENYGDMAIAITGDFSRDRATGTIRVTVAELTSDEQAQLCSSGDLTWVAHHQPLPARAPRSLGTAGRSPGSIVVRGPSSVVHLSQR
jgi:hypothetical protein